MAIKSGGWPWLAVNHLLVAGVALLGWVALALLAYFRQLPQEWPDRQAPIPDLFLLVVLLSGPAFLAAGVGLARRSRWGRLLTLGLGAAAALLAVAGIALVCVGILHVSRASDLVFLGMLPAYSVAVFAEWWKESHGPEAPQ
jgi:hypothetical protein